MMNLREKVMHVLKGSSSQTPVLLDTLRTKTASLVDDPQQLYRLLELLFAEHHVNRASGMKEGKPYVAYWLTGVNSPMPAFTVSKPRAHIVPRSETDPAPSPSSTAKAPAPIVRRVAPKKQTKEIPAFLRKPAVPIKAANTIKEATMPEKQLKPSAMIIEAVTNTPGISLKSLTDMLIKRIHGYTEKSAKAMVHWCQGVGKKIQRKGDRYNASYYPLDGKPTAAGKKNESARKAKPAAKAPALDIRKPAPITAPVPLAERIHFLLSENDQILLRDGANIIALDKAESARLHRFIERVGHN